MVCVIYEVFGDGDSQPLQNVIGVTSTVELAKVYINALITDGRDTRYKRLFDCMHRANLLMTNENNFTCVGNWKDVVKLGAKFASFGGFVIEEQHVISCRSDITNKINKLHEKK